MYAFSDGSVCFVAELLRTGAVAADQPDRKQKYEQKLHSTVNTAIKKRPKALSFDLVDLYRCARNIWPSDPLESVAPAISCEVPAVVRYWTAMPLIVCPGRRQFPPPNVTLKLNMLRPLERGATVPVNEQPELEPLSCPDPLIEIAPDAPSMNWPFQAPAISETAAVRW